MKKEMLETIKILDKGGADGIRMDFTEIRPNQLHTLDSKDYVSQYKWDGWFVALVVKGNCGTLYSRKNRYREDINCMGLEDNIYLAELIENTEWSYSFSGGNYHGKLVIYDLMFKEKSYLEELEKIRKLKIDNKLPNHIEVSSVFKGDIKSVYALALKLGFEGLVLINIKTGERIKVKKVIERDYVIMDFLKSDSDTAIRKGGMVASLMYGDGKRIIGKCSSMPHEMKIDMYRHPKQYIGRTVVISGREEFKSGALRHSAFERFRDTSDKKL